MSTELDVYHTTILPVVIRKIAKSIKELVENRRNRFPANDRVQIIVNNEQYREFRVIENIDNYTILRKMLYNCLIDYLEFSSSS